MAVWQLDLQIVPRQRVLDVLQAQEEGPEIAHVEEADWWTEHALPQGYEQRLASILPWRIPWAREWKVFGEDDGNRLDVIHDGEKIDEVRLRIDVREIDFDILERLVSFVAGCDCVFLSTAGHIVEPRVEDICVEIEASPAANFVSDPARFLEHLRRRRG